MKKTDNALFAALQEIIISVCGAVGMLILCIAFFSAHNGMLSEWKIYEIFSLFSFFSFFIIGFFIKKNPSVLKQYSKILVLFLCTLVPLIVVLIDNKRYSISHLIFLSLALITTIIATLYFRNKKIGVTKSISAMFNKTKLIEIFSMNALLIMAVLSYFFVDFDPHPIKGVLILFFFVLFVANVLFFLLNRGFDIHFSKRMRLVCLLLIFPLAWYVCQAPIEYHHYSFYMGPIFDISKGKSILLDTPSQYGYLSIHFLALILRKIGVTFNMFNFVNIMLFVSYYSLAGFIFFKLIKHVIAASMFTLIFMTLQTFFSHYTYVMLPSTGPIRFGLSLVVLGILIFAPKTKKLLWSSVFAAISIFWSPETAIYVVPAWFFACFVICFQITKTKKEFFGTILKEIGKFTCISSMIFAAIFLYEYVHFHTFPRLANYIVYVSAYKDGSLSMNISLYGNYYFAVIVLLLGLATMAHFVIRKKKAQLLPALSYLSISNVALLSYYVGRSHENNIVNISGFLFLELALVYALLHKEYGLTLRKIRYLVVVPIAIFIVLYPTRVVSQLGARTSYLSIIFKPNLVGWLQPVPPQKKLYMILKSEGLESHPVVLLDEKFDTLFLVESNIKNELPLNPAIMTTVLPDWKQRYVEPKIGVLPMGTVVIISTEPKNSRVLWDEIHMMYTMKKIGEKEGFEIAQIISRR